MRYRRGGFTLIELLVVVSVIGILVALIIPAVIGARQASLRVQCSNNLREIGVAIAGHVGEHGSFPRGGNGRSALAMLLPRIGETGLFNSINFDAPSEFPFPEGANRTAHQTTVRAFVCPSDRGPIGRAGPCNYGGNVGVGYTRAGRAARNGPFSISTVDSEVAPAAIRDGMSRMAMASESCRGVVGPPTGRPERHKKRSVIQLDIYDNFPDFAADCENADLASADLTLRSKGDSWLMDGHGRVLYNHNIGPNGHTCATGNDFKGAWTASSFHPGGVNVLYGDGRVSFVKETIDVQSWRSKGSIDGGEIAQADG